MDLYFVSRCKVIASSSWVKTVVKSSSDEYSAHTECKSTAGDTRTCYCFRIKKARSSCTVAISTTSRRRQSESMMHFTTTKILYKTNQWHCERSDLYPGTVTWCTPVATFSGAWKVSSVQCGIAALWMLPTHPKESSKMRLYRERFQLKCNIIAFDLAA